MAEGIRNQSTLGAITRGQKAPSPPYKKPLMKTAKPYFVSQRSPSLLHAHLDAVTLGVSLLYAGDNKGCGLSRTVFRASEKVPSL